MTEIDASAQLFSQAAILLMVGMTFVFIFLSLLIVIIKVVISPLGIHYPDPLPPIKNVNLKTTQDAINDAEEIVAAITVAINQYRQKHP